MTAPKISIYSQKHSSVLTNIKRLGLDEARQLVKIEKAVFSCNLLEEIVHTTIDEDTFKRLVLIRIPETEAITGVVRRLDKAAEYIKSRAIEVSSLPVMNKWFDRVLEIYLNFDYEKMGPIILVPLCDDEEKAVKNGSWYLEDGNHRALALALRIHLDGFKYEPIEALIVYPR